VASRDKAHHVVIDGADGTAYEEIVSAAPTFSPDSAHLAFVVKRSQQRIAVLDGHEHPPYYGLDETTLRFSPDSAHLAYAVWKVGWRLAVDGYESSVAVGEFVNDVPLAFDSPARVHGLGRAVPDGELVRLVTVLESNSAADPIR